MIGPHGEKRSGQSCSLVPCMWRNIATGEAEEEYVDAAKQVGGRNGGRVLADPLIPKQSQRIAKRAGRCGLGLVDNSTLAYLQCARKKKDGEGPIE